MFDNSYNYENPSVEISYKNFLYKYDPGQEKTIYIVHITSNDLFKISNVKYFFDAQSEAIKMLVDDAPEVDRDNSIIYTIYDLKRGIKFLPDVRGFSQGISFKSEVEENKNVTLGGIVAIVPPNHLFKYKQALIQLSRFFDPSLNADIVQSEQDAFLSIQNFK